MSSGTQRIESKYVKSTVKGDAAPAGMLGEHVSAAVLVASGVSLTTATDKNITSITLTPGDWEVSGTVALQASGANITAFEGSVNTVANTNATMGGSATAMEDGMAGSTNVVRGLATKQFNITAPTTIYLVAQATFATGTCKAYGAIKARRVR